VNLDPGELHVWPAPLRERIVPIVMRLKAPMAVKNLRPSSYPRSGEARRAARKKRTRPEPRQDTIADRDRARDRVEAAERRLDSDRTNHRACIERERARAKLRAIETNVGKRGILE
jgi:hypothetical protein